MSLGQFCHPFRSIHVYVYVIPQFSNGFRFFRRRFLYARRYSDRRCSPHSPSHLVTTYRFLWRLHNFRFPLHDLVKTFIHQTERWQMVAVCMILFFCFRRFVVTRHIHSYFAMPYSHHSHSGQFCKHAKGTLQDVVLEAIRQRFELYGLTEHVPRYRNQDLYPEEVRKFENLSPHNPFKPIKRNPLTQPHSKHNSTFSSTKHSD